MILFWKKLLHSNKDETFLEKIGLKQTFASYILLALMLIFGNSCVSEECAKPTSNLSTVTIIVPALSTPTMPCSYNPTSLNASTLVTALTNDGWVIQLTVGGECASGGVWSENYRKGDFGFLKNADGSFDLTLHNIPTGEPLSLKAKVYSDCNDNATGNCFEAGFVDYRAMLTGGIKKFTPTNTASVFLMQPLDENGIKYGTESGCQ